ncbi:conjugal transfer protein TraO [Pseudomonas syringae pv. syringae]|uniref:conjugal transfer protein TraO n=1 Tax=Pseudomonas syringae TaxID=317 RepID=UPI00200A2405|nr:conjugal transfer protein TraO [Pseudomonas syringae]MCK9759926.1 conjugal transfer protein TraO [Pseudomonas syringae pv. syringae]MCK9774917.1 conjugal transfer protein TraO [Pseudomonas syringae pv. syringae]
MAIEEDAGRDKKLTLGLIGAVLVIVFGGGYALYSWLNSSATPPSRISLERVPGASISGAEESPAYRALLAQTNSAGVNQARTEDTSFIASLSLQEEPMDPTPVKTQTKPVDQQLPRQQDGAAQAGGDATKTTNEALSKYLLRLRPDDDSNTDIGGGLQPARLLGASGAGAGSLGGAGDDSFQQWSSGLGGSKRASFASANSTTEANGAASIIPIEVIPPYWRGPGVIDLGVDSDNSTTPVLGKIQTGKFAGAVLEASDGAKLKGNGVEIHFTKLAYKGVSYRVDAYALQEETLLANVATDVNNRYFSRIVLPAVLGGIGNVGEMYSQANTELVSNGFNSQVVRPGVPDPTAVLGAIAGGAAGQAAKVLSDDAARTPAKQVLITKGQVVAIQFMQGVYSGDAISPGQGGDAVRPSIPAPRVNSSLSQPRSAEEWRNAAQSQVRSQQQFQELSR